MYEKQMELFEDGGLRDEGGMVDEESGNDVPVGSTRKEVRDDIPAMLSEGEFVFPADVVRYVGLDKLMQIRQEAKMGLKRMEAMGQMGNSDEATMPDDQEYPSLDILVLTGKEEDEDRVQELAKGGLLKAQAGTFVADTGLGDISPSVFEAEQAEQFDTFIPPSSMTPPEPIPAPEGGFRPKFLTDTGTVATPTVTKPITPSITTSVQGTEEKPFVPEVQDKYKPIKYINPETGEIRSFYFYNGNPVTPIPDGFVPYEETVNQEVVDDLESTTVDTAQVTDRNEDYPVFTPPKQEPIDYSSYSKAELIDAYNTNKTARNVLTAMGAINPLFAAFGQFATRAEQKRIEAVMKKKGVKVPETTSNILDRITEMVSGLFGKNKETVKRSIVSSGGSSSDLTSSLRPVPKPDKTTDNKPTYFTDAIRAREEKKKEEAIAKARRETDAILATSKGTTAQERAKRTGMTPVQTVAKAIEKDKPVFAGDDYDPRGKNQMGTPGKDNSKVTNVNTAANTAASKAVSQQQAVGKTESIEQKIKRGGGFSKGGLASRKKKK